MEENDIGTALVDCAVKLHQDLGPGLLESAYEVILAHKLQAHGLSVDLRRIADENGITRSIVASHDVSVSLSLCEKMIEQGAQPDAFGAGQL